eukprot:35987-Ditylum_brightwellii.AAC.1
MNQTENFTYKKVQDLWGVEINPTGTNEESDEEGKAEGDALGDCDSITSSMAREPLTANHQAAGTNAPPCKIEAMQGAPKRRRTGAGEQTMANPYKRQYTQPKFM